MQHSVHGPLRPLRLSVSFPLFSPCQRQISIQFSILQALPMPSFDAPVPLLSTMAITCKPLPFPTMSPCLSLGKIWPTPSSWEQPLHERCHRHHLGSAYTLTDGHPRVNQCPGCISEVFLAYILPSTHYPNHRLCWPLGFCIPTPIHVNLYPWGMGMGLDG